jgi:3-dehydroquinate dehydratase-2
MPARILVLHGPNLNLITDLADIDAQLDRKGLKGALDIKSFQANSEGALIDALHAERTKVTGIIVNAGKLAPSADVLAEALTLVKRPTVEVLFEQSLKSRSALKPVVLQQVVGRGAEPYLKALDVLSNSVATSAVRPTAAIQIQPGAPGLTVSDDEGEITGPIIKAELKKSLGRKQASEEGPTNLIRKTMGKGVKAIAEPSLSRAMVRDKISERLSGKLTPAGLATWARSQWQQIQRGAPVESGQRDRLEDVLQTLLLSASTKANDHQLIELMTQLG